MKKTVRGLDERVSRMVAHWPISWKPFFNRITIAGTPEVTFFISGMLIAAGLLLQSNELLYFGAVAFATLCVGTAMKLSIRRNRPDTEYVTSMKLRSYSFPSGHSVGSMIIYGGFAWLSLQAIGGSIGTALAMALLLFSLIIGISRVYLGAHYASDVFAGWLLGAAGILAFAATIRLV